MTPDFDSDHHWDDETMGAMGALYHPERNPDPKPDRTAIEAVLQRFADGTDGSEDVLVMRELAYCLLASGGKDAAPIPAARRAEAVLRAAGLHGTFDHHREFVRVATALEGFDGYTKASGIASARAAGALHHSVDDTTARKRLDRRGKL